MCNCTFQAKQFHFKQNQWYGKQIEINRLVICYRSVRSVGVDPIKREHNELEECDYPFQFKTQFNKEQRIHK